MWCTRRRYIRFAYEKAEHRGKYRSRVRYISHWHDVSLPSLFLSEIIVSRVPSPPPRHWIGASKHEGNSRTPHYGRPVSSERVARTVASVSFRTSNHESSIMKAEASGYVGIAAAGAVCRGKTTCVTVCLVIFFPASLASISFSTVSKAET